MEGACASNCPSHLALVDVNEWLFGPLGGSGVDDYTWAEVHPVFGPERLQRLSTVCAATLPKRVPEEESSSHVSHRASEVASLKRASLLSREPRCSGAAR
jgi:hypothetical protein